MTGRRQWMINSLAAACSAGQPWQVLANDSRLIFPRDAGAHPDFGIEWWYITGYTHDSRAQAQYGFQITFFRSKVPKTQAMRSNLAARQLFFAHAALTDVRAGQMLHDQRVARSSGAQPKPPATDHAWASTQDTDVRLADWSLQRQGDQLHARLHTASFAMDLLFTDTQPRLLQGVGGLSQKGPDPAAHSSYYYSLPQLQVQGTLRFKEQQTVIGRGAKAWLDHEWSHQIMPPGAVGWDWIGINFFDGAALTAFRLRDQAGAAVWDGGSWRDAQGLRNFSRTEVQFKPLRVWQSAASKASYPVEWLVQTPVGNYTVRALLDKQELDSRASTGGFYWEGLCEVWDGVQQRVGRGYLEMTGYASPLRL